MNPDPDRSHSATAAFLGLPPLTTTRLPGRSVSYRETSGPPGAPVVVLLHGFLATSGLNWMHAFAPLGQHFRVIAPDLCGHGGDAFERRNFTLEYCADDVAALVASLGLKRVIVVGYSMGGMVAQLVARRHGALIGGMVLSGVDWGSREYGRVSQLLSPVFMEAILRLIHLQVRLLRAPAALLARGNPGAQSERGALGLAAGEMSGHDPRAIGGAARAITLFRSIEWLDEITAPTTVLVTLRDRLFPQAEQRRMAQAVAAQVHEFDGGHVSARLPEYSIALVTACLDVSSRMAGDKKVSGRKKRTSPRSQGVHAAA